jgi:small subunit ribosomal protein S6
MVRYEGLLLAAPHISEDEAKSLESSLDAIVQSKQGSMISFERWGKYKLSYPVKKNEYGVYFLARFDTPQGDAAMIKEMELLFETKLNTLLMRSLFTRLEEGIPLAYQRPKSLEEMPAREEFHTKDRSERHKNDFNDFAVKPDRTSAKDEENSEETE